MLTLTDGGLLGYCAKMLHGTMTHKTSVYIYITVKTSNPTCKPLLKYVFEDFSVVYPVFSFQTLICPVPFLQK